MSSAEDHQDGNGVEAPALWEEDKGPGLVQPPEERASGDLTAACLEGLHSGAWWGQWDKTGCQRAARAGCSQRAGELGTQGDPSAVNALTDGAQPHRFQIQWAEPGASSRVHSQPQQVMNQIQGPSMESSQKQKETGPETGLETRLQHMSKVAKTGCQGLSLNGAWTHGQECGWGSQVRPAMGIKLPREAVPVLWRFSKPNQISPWASWSDLPADPVLKWRSLPVWLLMRSCISVKFKWQHLTLS